MIGAVHLRILFHPTNNNDGGPRTPKTPSLETLKKKWAKNYLCNAALQNQSLKQALQNLKQSTSSLRLTRKIEAAFRKMIQDYSPTYHDDGPEPLALSDAERQGKSNIRPHATEAWVWGQFFTNQGGAIKGNLYFCESDPTAIEDIENIYTRLQICEKWLRANPDILDRLIANLPD